MTHMYVYCTVDNDWYVLHTSHMKFMMRKVGYFPDELHKSTTP